MQTKIKNLWYRLETIATVLAQAQRKEDHAALMRHADMVVHGCKENLATDDDREDLAKRYETAVKNFKEGEYE